MKAPPDGDLRIPGLDLRLAQGWQGGRKGGYRGGYHNVPESAFHVPRLSDGPLGDAPERRGADDGNNPATPLAGRVSRG